jgi:hypothetical protein
VRQGDATFVRLYNSGAVTAEQIDDFIDAWHESNDSERRPLAEYLGMTEDEYSVWLASHETLPLLVAARHDGRPVSEVVRTHLATLRGGAAGNETAIHILSRWLTNHADS